MAHPKVSIQRTRYGQDRAEIAPLNARLPLPRRQYSYLPQRWLGAFVVGDAHAEAVEKLHTFLGISIPVKASEDLSQGQAEDVESFQDNLPVPEPSEEGSIVVVSVDCKGVPLVRTGASPDLSRVRTEVPCIESSNLDSSGASARTLNKT